MGRIAMIFGVLMILLGIGLYGAAVARAVNGDPPVEMGLALRTKATALIPAGMGLVLMILGMLAKNGSDSTRKHTMHAAALLALIGIALPAWRVVDALMKSTDDKPWDPLPVGGNAAMIVLSAIFLALCVKSFIDARRARKQSEAPQ